MTAADPVASRLLDRTGVCGARRLVLSRNHHKALKRAVVKVAELHDRLSVQLDEQVAQLVDD